MTSRDLSIDGQQFGLDFNPRFRKDFKTFDIDSLFKNETTRPIAAGFLGEVEGIQSKVQSDFRKMVDSDNIEKLGDEDREIYGKYLKMISKKILESKLSDLLDSFNNAEVRKRVFKDISKRGDTAKQVVGKISRRERYFGTGYRCQDSQRRIRYQGATTLSHSGWD